MEKVLPQVYGWTFGLKVFLTEPIGEFVEGDGEADKAKL